MQKLILILTLLSAVAPSFNVEPWRRIELEGYVRSEEGLVLFGPDEKRLYLKIPSATYYDITWSERLAFANSADYKQAERAIGAVVVIDGYLIRRGSDQFLVPVSLREKR